MIRARPDDRLVLVVVLSLAATAALFFVYLDQAPFFEGRLSRDQIFGRDFASFWTASWLVQSGRAAEIFDTDRFAAAMRQVMGREIGFNPFPYPPHGLWTVLPLAALPYAWSFALWTLGLLGLYLAAAAPAGRGLAALALVAAPSTAVTVTMGQNGFLSAALFIGGLRLLTARPVLAGVLFGLLSFKPQLGLLIPVALLAGRHWTALASAAATTLALIGWSLWFAGPDAWQAYLTVGLLDQARFMAEGAGDFMHMVPSAFMAMRELGLGAGAGYALQAGFALAAIAGVAWAFRSGGDATLLGATLLVGTFMVSPYVVTYDMTLISAAVLWLTLRGLDTGFAYGERIALGLAWLAPVLVMYASKVVPFGPLLILALFALTLHRIRGAGAAPRPVQGRGG